MEVSNKSQTAQTADSDILKGDKLYLQRALMALPYLVRQAKAEEPIYYSDLAVELDMPNARNLNYVLGAIGKALLDLGKRENVNIPPIQCVVINKQTKLPGEGISWFINKSEYSELADFNRLSKKRKHLIVKRVLIDIASFTKWEWVLEQFGLKPLEIRIGDELERAKKIRGNGGESPFHLEFKNFVASNPNSIGLSAKLNKGQIEYILPSADVIDIVFADKNTIVGVEVKSRISDTADILRGLFQCIKYKYLIEAEQIVNNKEPDSRIILALEGPLPTELISIKNILGIEVMDKIKQDNLQ